MKKRNIIKSLFILSLIVTILVAGCGKKDVPANESSSAEETPSDDASEIEEEEPDEASSKVESETEPADENYRQPVTYKDYMTEWMSIDYDSIEPVSEAGNTYDFNTDNLGYYTNGYIGFDFYQVQGDVIATNIFVLDYMMGTCYVDVMSPDTISFVYSQGVTEAYTDADGFISTGDMTESTIDLSAEEFIIDSTAKIGNTFSMNLYPDAQNYFYLYEDGDPDTSVFDTMSIGLYQKQSVDYIDTLKCINSYNPVSSPDMCYYENNQPLKDRLSMEQYPVYVKAVPEPGYYYWTENGEEPSTENGNFILAKVDTANPALSNNWSGIAVDLIQYDYYPDSVHEWKYEGDNVVQTKNEGIWGTGWYNDAVNGDGSATTPTGAYINFNYELPEYNLIGVVDGTQFLTTNHVKDDSSTYDNKVSMTVNNDGTLTFVTNKEVVISHNDDKNTPDVSDDELIQTSYSIGKDNIFKPIDASKIEALGLPE